MSPPYCHMLPSLHLFPSSATLLTILFHYIFYLTLSHVPKIIIISIKGNVTV
jgi:hypothetical protein